MDSKQVSQVTIGLVVVTIGLMMLAGQFEIGWRVDVGRMWPLVFVIIGLPKLLVRGERGTALWFVFLAGIFFMHTYRVLSLRQSWPLFIVMAGVSMMFPDEKCKERRPRKQVTEVIGDGRSGS